VPYRIDVAGAAATGDELDTLIELGALDVEPVNGGLAAIIPDAVSPDVVATALHGASVAVSTALGRDDGSVWVLSPRRVRLGRVPVVPAGEPAAPRTLRLTDSPAFGTGLHPTTVLCAEAIDAAVVDTAPGSLLDVGTGSGVLALAALLMGVPRATALDIDATALDIAAAHARLNGLEDRLQFVLGRPDAVDGAWPLVVANVLAAPLIEMASMLVRRVGHHGRLILSGIPRGVALDVEQAYVRLGMRSIGSETRAGWTVLVLRASW
jgi:ribosomal protein L11 methyltransferase